MRVTNRSLMDNYMVNLNRNLLGMKKYQNQLASGKEISRPSDDPFRVLRAMNYDTAIDEKKQHLKNIDYARGWVDSTDTAIQGTVTALNHIRERVVQGSTGTLSNSDMKAIADEVKQTIDQIGQIANTSYDSRYIFAGYNTIEPPFKTDATGMLTNDKGDNGIIIREIAPNITMDVNVDAVSYYGGAEDLGTTLKNVYDRLLAGDTTALSNDSIDKIDDQVDKFLAISAEIGAKQNRLDAAYEKNEQETINMTELLSKTEDIDVAEKVMQYSMMEMVYQASLSCGAKILQPTLLNYL